ncbi:copper-binding protein [Beijerinckia indica]|uniref:Copper-binding protein n=1 Tax=Beijerinckia indica subsp. indica (strain ATCC 9039 / DSM 1715 / NCIMB 8712) TaxID=395963 RepID=B2IDB3_BEII9|nr:copper-binding protein [Beijerinckia indica]ACB93970.1 conserved hypothetical protein [Beijerinckia indica subsp. indica ATCC 9039]
MSLRLLFTSAAIACLVFAAPASCFAAQLFHGEVRAVDAAQGKITLKHEPIRKLDMEEGMTMVYRIKEPSLLQGVVPGEHVLFDAEKVDGRFTVTHLEKAK